MPIRVSIAFILLVATPTLAQVSTLFDDEEAREHLRELSGRLEVLESGLKSLIKQSASLTAQKQGLVDQLRDLSSLVDETTSTAELQTTRIKQINLAMEQKVTNYSQRLSGEVKDLASSLVSSASKLYARALRDKRDDKFETATQRLRQLIRQFPDSEFSPPARYWLGEMAHNSGEYIIARDELVALLTAHPNHSRIPDALSLLINISQYQSDTVEEKHWRHELLQRHPTSAAADRLRLDLVNSLNS